MSPAAEVERLRQRLTAGRVEHLEAEDRTSRLRWALAEAEAGLASALRLGDVAEIERASERRRAAGERHDSAVRRLGRLRDQVHGGLGDLIDELGTLPGAAEGTLLPGVDQGLPIALLPVRLETRFAGPDDAPVLKVRIFPDDLHLDDHEPDLSQEEAEHGRAYWIAVRSGTTEGEAWSVLSSRLGAYRALWVRERLEPIDSAHPPTFPEVTLRPAGTSRAAVARALPDLFLVRTRVAGTATITPGLPVADTLQVGIDLSGSGLPPTTANPADPTRFGDDVVVLGEDARWLSDFAAAVEAGMAVEVPLPASTRMVEEVAVAGVCVSLDAESAGTLVVDLLDRHRVTHGAGFIPPGTPTNNLADSTSGWSDRPDPARLDPAIRPVPGDSSNAAVLARALGIEVDHLAGLVGAADADSAEAGVMARALFEATWGPYLRTQAQPGFPLRLLPQVHHHVTTWLRGGGPLPALRLGHQPYGVLPVQPRQAQPADGDDAFTRWLFDHLPELRALWLSGVGQAPSGVAAYTHEPVSSRVRVRTANASSTHPWAAALGLVEDETAPGVRERRIVAELGLGAVLPTVVSQLFTKDAVDLWMPMSNDTDLDFPLVAPSPKDATSILGLLLRNAALQVTSNVADQLITPVADAELVGLAAAVTPAFHLTRLSEVAVSASPEVTLQAVPTLQDKLAIRTRDGAGVELTVRDRIGDLLGLAPSVQDLARYRHTEAFATYRNAHADLAAIPSERRARLAGEVLDCASHRYDAWVTSLATQRLDQVRRQRPTGLQLGAWGLVERIQRRALPLVGRDDLPDGTVRDTANHGFVVAPSLQHADVAGVLRAAWIAHGGPAGDAESPFAVDLRSERLRQALALADGMRNGQQLGALLGYQLERALHDASGAGTEVDWAVFELRRRYPLTVATAEDAGLPSERQVVDGWRVAQDAMKGLDPVVDAVMTDVPPGLDAGSCRIAIAAAVVALIGALDGLTDLGLAESVQQLAGSNFARASAATDMISRAAVPPDAFDVAATPRGGQGIDQRLLAVFGGEDRPAGYAATSPRAALAPEADAFVARRLGPLSDLTVRLLDGEGAEIGAAALAGLGLAALDLAADAASTGSAAPFPVLLALVRAETGHLEGASIALDPDTDADLIDLLEHAARWHQALAGRRPLSASTLRPRGEDAPGGDPADDDGGALAGVLGQVEALATEVHADDPGHPDPLDLDALVRWGIDARTSQTDAKLVLSRRVAEARAAADAPTAARALFGGDCVVTGRVALPDGAPWATAQGELGVGRGDLAGWVQDTGRVSDPARALDEALLYADLRGTPEPLLSAAQTPAVAGAVGPEATTEEVAAARRWVGRAFPGPIGRQPVVSFVVVHDEETPVGAASAVGVEVDAWVEVVPDRDGAGAVAANLSSPDSRAPNTILLAVPGDLAAPWTQESLFSVIDEALELARCRLVDLDASRRVPAVLPAIYISEFDDEVPWRDLIATAVDFPARYLTKGQP